MAAEDSIPEQIWSDRKLKIGPSVRPSPVFKAIERLSLRAKSFGFILEPRIENAIFYTVLQNRLAIEREQGSR